MRKLLRANFARLWKDKVFWGVMIFGAVYGILGCVSQYQLVLEGYETTDQYARIFMNDYLFSGVALAAFTNLFLGCEYSDGTIRNKLITGCTRTQIYLSNYVTCVCAGVMMQAAYSLTVSALAIPMFGVYEQYLGRMAVYSLLGILLIASETAIYTLVSMLCQNKAVAAVLCQVGTFLLLFAAVYLLSKLSQPEMIQSAVQGTDGSYVVEMVKNPAYLSGAERKWYQFGMDFLPTGQSFTIAQLHSEHPQLLALYMGAVIVVCSVAGILGFHKKDLK